VGVPTFKAFTTNCLAGGFFHKRLLETANLFLPYSYKIPGDGRSKPTRKQKLIRQEFPKVRQYQKRGYTYYAVDLRRAFWRGQPFKSFSNRTDALKYATELGESVQTNGVASVAKNLANFEDERLTRWNEQLGAHGKSVEDAVVFFWRIWSGIERSVNHRMPNSAGILSSPCLVAFVPTKPGN
jgi:hypothetical protein